METSSGVAVRVPDTDTRIYDEQVERNKDRYAPLCVNCERMIKQIARWGKSSDKVTDKFSVGAWVLPNFDSGKRWAGQD